MLDTEQAFKIMNQKLILLLLLFSSTFMSFATPIDGLLERIDKGASKKFVIEKIVSDKDVFELDQQDKKVVVRGNNYVSIATGINWYLKYYVGIHLSWNGMTAKLPDVLPPVTQKERHETSLAYRYYLNYCTFSYSMAFWDWERWEKEIDWMALHGINLPLAITGTEAVWRNVLRRLNYSTEEINQFISGPGFFAWWLMNNLEGWGGPNPDSWYEQQISLQKKILNRMREYGIEPVLPGYCGMVPHNAKEKLGLNAAHSGTWCGYPRPAFLQPQDPRFDEISSIYYQELEKLYGKANFYSMDPFHEGAAPSGVNLDLAGKAVMHAMKKTNPNAVWVVQAWGGNPQEEMIKNLQVGDLLILDLHSECRPQWGDSTYQYTRKNGFAYHNWTYGMLLNFGGNVGLHGKMDAVINGFYDASSHPRFGNTLQGIGLLPEGIENNPVMYELFLELPWRPEHFDKNTWLDTYVLARYGKADSTIRQAWQLLGNGIYNSPKEKIQQGTHESVFCARPDIDVYQVSAWAETKEYYNPKDVVKAAELLLSVADNYKGNNNFEYDLVDIVRQSIAEKGRLMLKVVSAAYKADDKDLFTRSSKKFLHLIELQDKLLATRPEFTTRKWIETSRALGKTPEEKKLYEWNARVQISTWGNRVAAEQGQLRDYAHKEWNGILKELYLLRWQTYFDYLTQKLDGKQPQIIDFYTMEESWANATVNIFIEPDEDCITTAKKIFETAMNQ